MRTMILLIATCWSVSDAALAVDVRFGTECCDEIACRTLPDACDRCGCAKVCKVVCEMKDVTKTVWTVECEEFCAPLPGCGNGCCGDRKTGCDEMVECDSCVLSQKPMACPKCGPLRSRKKLVKKEITCKVPVYRCIIANCDRCGDDNADARPAATATSQAVPQLRATPTLPVHSASYIRWLKGGR